MKIRIKDAEHSAKVQEALFAQGCLWAGAYEARVAYSDKSFLFMNKRDDDSCKITYCDSEGFFDSVTDQQYFLAQDGTFMERTLGNLLKDKLDQMADEPYATGEMPFAVPIRTRQEWLRDRMWELLGGIEDKMAEGRKVPQEWVEELAKVNGEIV